MILTALCGHGHFDLAAYDAYLNGRMVDLETPDIASSPPWRAPDHPRPARRLATDAVRSWAAGGDSAQWARVGQTCPRALPDLEPT